MQRSAVVVVADKTSLKRPFIFANAVHMVGTKKKKKLNQEACLIAFLLAIYLLKCLICCFYFGPRSS